MNSREGLMYANAYSEMKPHPTRRAAGDSGSSAASAAVRYFNPSSPAVAGRRGRAAGEIPPGPETSGIALSSRRYGAGRLTEAQRALLAGVSRIWTVSWLDNQQGHRGRLRDGPLSTGSSAGGGPPGSPAAHRHDLRVRL